MPVLQPPSLQSLGIATRFGFGGVPPDQTVIGNAGCYAPAGGTVSITIVNDTSAGRFKIGGVTIFQVERVIVNGELPPGVNRRPVFTWQLVQLAQFSGSQPFQAAAGQVIDVTLAFTSPTQPTGVTYTASVQVAGTTWSRTLPATGTAAPGHHIPASSSPGIWLSVSCGGGSR